MFHQTSIAFLSIVFLVPTLILSPVAVRIFTLLIVIIYFNADNLYVIITFV